MFPELSTLLLLISAATPLPSAASPPTLRQQQPPAGASLNLWCVARNNADDSALQSAIDWACGTGGADCTPIQQGNPCYDPADIRKTASYAFNDYCTKNGMTEDACNFANTAALTTLDPSHSSCKFPSSCITSDANLQAMHNGHSEQLLLRKLGFKVSDLEYYKRRSLGVIPGRVVPGGPDDHHHFAQSPLAH
ncbi:hypothetical protein SSX86_027911 [Deinandra increscens subsp. villosa]|uniref:X8 domain-containing protein n=1 Tax=Deinandra increscens subsp. villosa TaxID=3103831 RepID=A0AAP0GKA7_9ASTR